MERTVSIFPIQFGTRVFIRAKGAFREAEYRGIYVKDPNICGVNMIVKHIFWLGNKIGGLTVDRSAEIYMTAEDVITENNRVSYETISIESFSLRYLRHLSWDGIQFTGWIWDGARPERKATRECLSACEVRGDGVSLIDRHGNIYDIDKFSRFYQTREECMRANKPVIVMMDDEDKGDEGSRDMFYEYVKHHCPGFEDKIEWGRFVAEKGMPWNLSDQVMFFIQTS